MTATLAGWAAAGPQDALAWASALTPRNGGERTPSSRREELGAVLAGMAIHWPDEANSAMEEIADWNSQLSGMDWHRQRIYNAAAFQDVIRDFAERAEPRRAAAWFESHPDERMRWRHAEDVARAYAAAHPEERWRGRGHCRRAFRATRPCGEL